MHAAARGAYVAMSAALVLAPTAKAGGFSTPVIGSRMIGRIGFVAKADDTTAVFHNPAGLAFQKGMKVEASAISFFSHTLYRVNREDGSQSEVIEFEDPQGVLPFAGFSGDFGTDRWVFGIGLYSPHNTAATLPEDSEARFQLIEGRIVTLFLTPTVAYRIRDDLAVGVGVSVVAASAGLKRWTNLGAATGIPIDAIVEISAKDHALAWDAGLMWRATDRFTLGIDYQSPVRLGFGGDLTAVNDEIGLRADADVHVDFTLPQAVRVGVNAQITDRLDVGFDAYWQDYSVYHDLTLDLTNVRASLGGGSTAFADTSIEELKLSEDILGFGLGGTYVFDERWEASAGLLYDPSPYPDKTYTILSPDADKYGAAVGVGCSFERIALHLSYLRLQYRDRIVTESVLTPPANGAVEGKFNNIMALQATYRF